MDYHGFHSISEYERECSRLGFKTRHIPIHKNGGRFFALITSCPVHPTGTSVESWTLFTADESARVLDGIISGGMMDPAQYIRGGLDVNWHGKLAAHGYYPDSAQDAPTKPAPTSAADETGQLCFQF